MSTPRIHHYVSLVLIKKIVDSEDNLYTYFKSSALFEEKILDRFDFAEKDLNSIITATGEIDHKSFEDNLDKYIETDFNKHYDKILAAIASENYSELNTSMEYLMRMGVIGDMRTP